MVSSPYFNNLKCLNLEDNSIDDEGCKILAESENMRNLTSLKLSVKHLRNVTLDGLSYVFSSTHLSNLQSLFLKGFDLKGLELNDNKFGDMLMKSSFRNNLKSVTLSYCDVDTLNLHHIAQLDQLRKLKIVHYHTIASVCECIASSPHMSNLTSLKLVCGVTDSDCLHLADSVYLTQLTTLNVSSNQIGLDGCEYFANSPNFPNLTILELGDNKKDHEGLKMIRDSPYFQHLKPFNKM